MRDRRTLAVVGAAFVAIGAIVVVLLTSVAQVPGFSSLQDHPQTGVVAYLQHLQGDPRQELSMVDLAGGTSTTVPVALESELLGWDEDGSLVLIEWLPSGMERTVAFDPSSGEVVREITFTDADRERLRGEYVWTENRQGRLTFVSEVDTFVASFAAPSSYGVPSASLMGDDRVVFIDELGRVGVLRRDADAVPVLVAEAAAPWSPVLGRF
jgi:hypothetical protein